MLAALLALLTRFFKIWTAKEAYFKQQGTGITDLKAVHYHDLAPLHFEEDGCMITII
jgi:phosphopantetheinyl transferase